MHGFESELYFYVPVWADLIRVVAHACACLCLGKHYNCFLMILPKICMHSFESKLYFHAPVSADLIRELAVSTCLCLGKHYNCFLVILTKICMHSFESKLYFHAPVWAYLIRVLAHACAWENTTIACLCLGKHYNCFLVPKICMLGFESELYFHVPVWADKIRLLAHACAWENITIASL